jgi:hypothetical protein
MMDIHDKVHYALAAVLAGTIGAVSFLGTREIQKIKPEGYNFSASDVASLPFGHHAYSVFPASGSGPLPESLASAIESAGNTVKIEGDLLPHAGIWVSPDTDEGKALADAISKLVGEPVKVGNADGGAFEIGVGQPLGKKDAAK